MALGLISGVVQAPRNFFALGLKGLASIGHLYLDPLDTAPTDATEGRVYYDGTQHALLVSNGTGYQAVQQDSETAVTATADGTGTGAVPVGARFATVTSGGANDIVTLPAPVVGTQVRLMNGATGYELRSSAPATIGINGGVGAAAESAIAASILVTCVCTTATNWVCMNQTAAGVVAATQVAAA